MEAKEHTKLHVHGSTLEEMIQCSTEVEIGGSRYYIPKIFQVSNTSADSTGRREISLINDMPGEIFKKLYKVERTGDEEKFDDIRKAFGHILAK